MIIRKQNNNKPLTGVSIKVENPRNVYDLYTRELAGLSPDAVKEYLEYKFKGSNFFCATAYDYAARVDLRLGSLIQTRKLALASKEWLLEYPDDSTLSESEQKETIRFLKEVYEQIEIESYICQSNNAQVRGVQNYEVIYATDGAYLFPERIDAIPAYLYMYDDRVNEYRYLDYEKADTLALRTAGNISYSQDRFNVNDFALPDINPLKIIEVHSLDGDAMNGFMNGCVDSLLFAFLFKNYGLKDWAIYIERFAVPAVIAKYPALMNDQDRAVLENAVRNFGHLFNALIPKESEMNFSGDGNKSGSTDMLKNYQDFWNTEMSLRLLGQTGTTSKLDGGSYAAINALEGVRHDIILGDLIVSARAVNNLNRLLKAVNPDKIKELPMFKFKQLKDMEAMLKHSQMLVNLYNAGYEVDENDVLNLKDAFNFMFTKKPLSTAPGSSVGFSGKFIQDAWLTKWLKENQ